MLYESREHRAELKLSRHLSNCSMFDLFRDFSLFFFSDKGLFTQLHLRSIYNSVFKSKTEQNRNVEKYSQTGRTEHSQGFSICFIIKNPLNFPRITFNFQNKLYFQSEQQCRQHALYSHKARYNKPIRIPVRMVQII